MKQTKERRIMANGWRAISRAFETAPVGESVPNAITNLGLCWAANRQFGVEYYYRQDMPSAIQLFAPDEDVMYFWKWRCEEGNKCRATAAGFLAAMAETGDLP